MNRCIDYIQPILKGEWIRRAVYLGQEVKEYMNNPCIEALPRIFDDSEIVEKLLYYPNADETEKKSRDNVRYHYIRRLEDFVQPLEKHLKIEHTLSTLIRRGYLSRNLASNEYLARLRLINEVRYKVESEGITNVEQVTNILNSTLENIPETRRSSAQSSSIIGTSGMGKSLAVEKLFMLYPQVISHNSYKGNALTRTQIVWVKIDSPSDGSLKTLCKMFFRAIDDILLTTELNSYSRKYANNKHSTATMMINMAYVSCLHSIGVLAIDEMQYLINPKNKPDEIQNFLVTLVNTIGVPIIQIGTPKILRVWDNSLAQLRRAQQGRCIPWDRMNKDSNWDFFVESMWPFQWLKNFTPLTEELSDEIYFHSQGITSIAVSLFALTQAEAIYQQKETISKGIIEKVSKEDLRLTQDLIKAIRNNNIKQIEKYEDVRVNLNDLFKNKMQILDNAERIKKLTKEIHEISKKEISLRKEIATTISAMNIVKNMNYTAIEKMVEESIKQYGSHEDVTEIKKIAFKLVFKEDERLENEKTKS